MSKPKFKTNMNCGSILLYDIAEYEILSNIEAVTKTGSGYFGNIYKGTLIGHPELECAIKVPHTFTESSQMKPVTKGSENNDTCWTAQKYSGSWALLLERYGIGSCTFISSTELED